jgi:rare lipoprotein A
MASRQETSKLNRNASLRVYIAAGATSIVLAAGVVTVFFAGTVQADVPLARPLATLPPRPPVEDLTPAMLAPPVVLTSEQARMLRGIATWYGPHFNGRRTASGEKFDQNALTACHPTLPFGSMVRVKNLRNKRSVVVRITDRGYLLEGRIIDLSYAAAEKLEMTKNGIAPVVLEVIALGPKHLTNGVR